ncbi:hypothetical protein [Streptomyces fragilis]|uniref:Regulatory protein n=1 Tax=Streptomyces fragilis TaxID=67301 RepID=A0ABV2YDH5_9ACTN|nr:hypothetical protein [Streptomyces fragilis]
MREESGGSCEGFAEGGTAARLKLAALLRSWWQEDPGRATQSSLARKLGERGVKTSQEMLSRYLHRTRPTVARRDVIRALHAVLERADAELAEALELHAAARGDDVGSAPAGAGGAAGPPVDQGTGARVGAGADRGSAGGSGAGGGAGAVGASGGVSGGRGERSSSASASAPVPVLAPVPVSTPAAAAIPAPTPASASAAMPAPAPVSVGAGASASAAAGEGTGVGIGTPVVPAVGVLGRVPLTVPRPRTGAGVVTGPASAAAPVAGAAPVSVVTEQDLRWRRWSAAVTAAAAAAAGMVLTAAVTLGDAQDTRLQAPPVCPVAPTSPAPPQPS